MKMFRSCVFFLGVALAGAAAAHGQAIPAATRAGILTVGGDLSYANTDTIFIKKTVGVGLFANYDLGPHLSADLDVHLQAVSTPDDYIEDTYLIGPRYNLHYRHFSPYFKVLAGIGTTSVDGNEHYTFVPPPASYFTYALGGGVDVPVHGHWMARADVEQQFWPGFSNHGITPVVASVGIGYKFRP